jgi:hypothetical protein
MTDDLQPQPQPSPSHPGSPAGASNVTLWAFLIGISLLLLICVIFILVASLGVFRHGLTTFLLPRHLVQCTNSVSSRKAASLRGLARRLVGDAYIRVVNATAPQADAATPMVFRARMVVASTRRRRYGRISFSTYQFQTHIIRSGWRDDAELFAALA